MRMRPKQCNVIAEVGAVHLGEIDRAHHLIDLATQCGVDYVKFQKRNPEESTPEHIKYQPHPNQIFAYGKTYLEHRQALELSIDQHRELKEHCDENGVQYSCSVWDWTSAEEIIAMDVGYIKVPSALNQEYGFMDRILRHFKRTVHISTGMISREDRRKLVDFLAQWPDDRYVLYHCTSEYPCPFDRLCLLDIEEISAKGFSNHGYGISCDIAAYILGAEWIERHFVDDRTIRHTDASFSLEPDGLQRLCRDLKAVYSALQYSGTEMTDGEVVQHHKLKGL